MPDGPADHHHPRVRRAGRAGLRAWADPDLVAPVDGAAQSIDMRIDEWDCRTGGSYRYAAGRDGDEVAGFYGSFHEVRPGERLVQTFTFEGVPDGVAWRR